MSRERGQSFVPGTGDGPLSQERGTVLCPSFLKRKEKCLRVRGQKFMKFFYRAKIEKIYISNECKRIYVAKERL